MDILSLVSNEQRMTFAQNLTYDYNFMGDKLFTKEKTYNMKAKIRQLAEGGNLPVMAQVHSHDTEARIGNRPDFEELVYSKLLIKEKINTSERIIEALGNNASRDEIIDYLFDDYNMEASRCMTRCEVARMELLATGKVTYKENEQNITVDYHVPAKNIFDGASDTLFKDWDTADADILGALTKVTMAADKKGYSIVRAICSTTILEYMLKNTKIQTQFYKTNTPTILTKETLKAYLRGLYGIEFVENNSMYKVDAKDTQARRFFPEMNIAFLTTEGTVGTSIFGYTPEELGLRDDAGITLSEKNYVTITSWKEPDPVAVWTKASTLFLPVLKDSNSLFIAKITT